MSGYETPRRHRRDDVAETALRILDEHGLAELTMRRLAAALDVQPSALYHHFENKQTLLAELADRIVARAGAAVEVEAAAQPAPDAAPALARAEPAAATAIAPTDWARRVRIEAHALRDALLAYRDGAEVVSSSYALGLDSGRALARLRDAVRAGGFDELTSTRAATALLHFILGHVSHEQQRLQYDAFGIVAPAAALEPGRPSGQADDFAFGVALLSDGLEHARALGDGLEHASELGDGLEHSRTLSQGSASPPR